VDWHRVAMQWLCNRDVTGQSCRMFAYERLYAWRAAHRMALEIYRITDAWPKEERFGITIQLRRAAVSVPNNIAEGAGKRGSKEFRRFLDMALGSLSEVSYLLLFSKDRGLLNADDWQTMDKVRGDASRLTWRLYDAVSKHADRPR
jgi:four helix bundle protein